MFQAKPLESEKERRGPKPFRIVLCIQICVSVMYVKWSTRQDWAETPRRSPQSDTTFTFVNLLQLPSPPPLNRTTYTSLGFIIIIYCWAEEGAWLIIPFQIANGGGITQIYHSLLNTPSRGGRITVGIYCGFKCRNVWESTFSPPKMIRILNWIALFSIEFYKSKHTFNKAI